ncbi:MAG: 5'-nucleotidase C-terminal domain-containing protein [Duncaniella sp.]|nr:5'-nucleotidase C-terminal domain-containing protein [Duncaniella sp.]
MERGGRRGALIGLLTPAVAEWVPADARRGLTVESMIETARRLVAHVRALEHPDIIVGLFHSGYQDPELSLSTLGENFSARIAAEVEGFDLIVMGHDHTPTIRKSPSGCLLADAGAGAEKVVHAVISPEGTLTVSLPEIKNIEPDAEFCSRFAPVYRSVASYVSRHVGRAAMDYYSGDALKGSSPFMQVIHEAQLRATGARISFAAPPQSNASISAGELKVADMYKFYRFDNGLSVLRLSGREIRDFLEWSYELRRPYLDPDADLHNAAPVYNLDSAFGIDYSVDYSRPYGERVEIHSLTDTGELWDPEAFYEVAMNSYRACGGGGHLTKGAHISMADLSARIVSNYGAGVRDAVEEYFSAAL